MKVSHCLSKKKISFYNLNSVFVLIVGAKMRCQIQFYNLKSILFQW